MTINILGFEISNAGINDDISSAIQIIQSKQTNCKYVACANPHSLVLANKDTLFRNALNGADRLLPDGAGIILAAKLLDLPIKSRVAGNDYFHKLSIKANEKKLKYFFLGSTKEVLRLIEDRLEIEYPGIEVCGTFSPVFTETFSQKEKAEMIKIINDAKPDVLWVGMTAPKQEKWLFESREQIKVPLAAAIGAVFDFYAGTKKRAPEWVCNIGLEWLPRLLREPKRLWQRNFISSPLFLKAIFLQKFNLHC